MTSISVASFIALLITGLQAGIFAGNRLGTSIALPRIPDSSFIMFQQTIHRVYVKVMPVLQILAIFGSFLWVYLARGSWSGTRFILLLIAAIGSVVVLGITLSVNVPINKKLMTWDSSNPPANNREVWGPWESANTVRAIVAVVVFVLEVLVVSMV